MSLPKGLRGRRLILGLSATDTYPQRTDWQVNYAESGRLGPRVEGLMQSAALTCVEILRSCGQLPKPSTIFSRQRDSAGTDGFRPKAAHFVLGWSFLHPS